MRLNIFQVDAFSHRLFRGNPAAICPLDSWLEDDLLQQIAQENNLSETAFFVRNKGDYDLRWFTPTFEIDLCGHATLASAHVIFQHPDNNMDTVTFHTKSGPLTVKKDNGLLSMEFPSRPPQEIDPPQELIKGLGAEPKEVLSSRDIMAVFSHEDEVAALEPDFQTLSTLDTVGIIATARGKEVDFISRFFAPRAGVNEDPVTGSAHCTLIPYWANVLGKNKLSARQISKRGGDLTCKLVGDRVIIMGGAVTYLTGHIDIDISRT